MGEAPLDGLHLAGQAAADLFDLEVTGVARGHCGDHLGGHFFSSDPASTDSLTALTLR